MSERAQKKCHIDDGIYRIHRVRIPHQNIQHTIIHGKFAEIEREAEAEGREYEYIYFG